ncbi:MAG: PorT family protein [Bacteroidales bacterium]|nr:PorT family protein [Bacteroidales bacterium]MCF8403301.1 PorT family protein [Bacteroidales bacterium]
MKKITILTVIAVVTFSLGAMAQFTFGPRLGVNLANQSGDDVSDNSMLLGFNIGVMGNIAVNEMFSVQAEALYDAKGAKYESINETGDKENVNGSFNYLNIPIMAKATFGDDMKFFGQVGPTIGLLMGAKWDGESEFTTYEQDPNNPFNLIEKKEKVKDFYSSTDLGLVIGAGTLVPLGGMKLLVDLRYNMSLASIGKEMEVATGFDPLTGAITYETQTPDIKNGVISINFGIVLGGD